MIKEMGFVSHFGKYELLVVIIVMSHIKYNILWNLNNLQASSNNLENNI